MKEARARRSPWERALRGQEQDGPPRAARPDRSCSPSEPSPTSHLSRRASPDRSALLVSTVGARLAKPAPPPCRRSLRARPRSEYERQRGAEKAEPDRPCRLRGSERRVPPLQGPPDPRRVQTTALREGRDAAAGSPRVRRSKAVGEKVHGAGAASPAAKRRGIAAPKQAADSSQEQHSCPVASRPLCREKR